MRRSWPLDAKGMAMVFRSSDAAAGRGESKCMLYELYRFFFAQTQSEKLHNHSHVSLQVRSAAAHRTSHTQLE